MLGFRVLGTGDMDTDIGITIGTGGLEGCIVNAPLGAVVDVVAGIDCFPDSLAIGTTSNDIVTRAPTRNNTARKTMKQCVLRKRDGGTLGPVHEVGLPASVK